MLNEAARWVDALGVAMWDEEELAADSIAAEVAAAIGAATHARER